MERCDDHDCYLLKIGGMRAISVGQSLGVWSWSWHLADPSKQPRWVMHMDLGTKVVLS